MSFQNCLKIVSKLFVYRKFESSELNDWFEKGFDMECKWESGGTVSFENVEFAGLRMSQDK